MDKWQQMSLFDAPPLRVRNTVRLIELFSGIGSQAKAMERLGPKECWRLMDFDDEDFDKARSVVSNTQLYSQAGNSIVVNCLVAIFGQLYEGKEEVYKDK